MKLNKLVLFLLSFSVPSVYADQLSPLVRKACGDLVVDYIRHSSAQEPLGSHLFGQRAKRVAIIEKMSDLQEFLLNRNEEPSPTGSLIHLVDGDFRATLTSSSSFGEPQPGDIIFSISDQNYFFWPRKITQLLVLHSLIKVSEADSEFNFIPENRWLQLYEFRFLKPRITRWMSSELTDYKTGVFRLKDDRVQGHMMSFLKLNWNLPQNSYRPSCSSFFSYSRLTERKVAASPLAEPLCASLSAPLSTKEERNLIKLLLRQFILENSELDPDLMEELDPPTTSSPVGSALLLGALYTKILAAGEDLFYRPAIGYLRFYQAARLLVSSFSMNQLDSAAETLRKDPAFRDLLELGTSRNEASMILQSRIDRLSPQELFSFLMSLRKDPCRL